MKKFIGLFLLVLVLVAVSGCTQTVKPSTPATMVPTTVLPTEIPTTLAPTEQATLPAVIPTTQADANITAVVTTVATPAPVMTPSTKITTIHIRNNSFVPAELTVLPGTGITWVNDDSVPHIVKATGDHAGKFTSSIMITSGTFGYTFGDAAGIFEYTDPNFPGMNGTINVVKGAAVVGAPTVQSTASP